MKYLDYEVEKEVEIEGVKFRLGFIPTAKYRSLSMFGMAINDRATQRAIKGLRERGEEATEDAILTYKTRDVQWMEDLEAHYRTLVAWGVRGHEGAPFPFAGAEREFMGRKYKGASDDTVARYADDEIVLTRLYTAVLEFNTLGDAGKDDSSAPSSSHAAKEDGPATNAQPTEKQDSPF